MKVKEIEDFLKYMRVVKKCSKNTLTNYEDDLLELYDFYTDLVNIDEIVVREYLEYMYSKGISRSSISRKLSSMRSFYNYLIKEGKITKNYFKEISNPKKDRVLPKYIKSTDLEKIFNSFDKNKVIDVRNLLIFEMLYATGVRISELISIKINDIDRYNNSIKILGKGSKERIVFYGKHAKDILDLYLRDARLKLLNGKSCEYLFLNKYGDKLSSRYIRNIINDVERRCVINYHISPHTFRHTFATDMLNEGSDLITVKELLGHSTVDTTSIYTHLSIEQVKNVYNLAHPRAKE